MFSVEQMGFRRYSENVLRMVRGANMSSQTAMTLMCVVEFALWAVFGLLFWTRKLHRRFPAMGSYLALRVASMLCCFSFTLARRGTGSMTTAT
jgi:hypothetical protein